MKKTYKTEPPKLNYKIWDCVDKQYILRSKKLEEIINAVKKLNDRYRGTWFEELPRYIVLDHWDDEIDCTARLPKRSRYGYSLYGGNRPYYEYETYDEYVESNPDVRCRKKNVNKIKGGYNTADWEVREANPYSANSDYIIGGCYRRMSTFPEARRNVGDCADYGIQTVRGRRRKGNVPSAYDDIPNASYDHAKSWKKHSKRRHQYKLKE